MALDTKHPATMATPCRVRLNVGGKVFMTTADTLRSLPDTRLGRLAGEDPATPQQELELFFDRNPKIINSLLDLYRTGELHVPKSLCARTVERELEFWGIPKELIRECCFREFQEHKEDAEITAEIDQFLRFPYDTAEDCQQLSRLGRVWLMMERPGTGLASKVWSGVFLAMVAISVVLYCLSNFQDFLVVNPLFLEDMARQNTSWETYLANLTVMKQQFMYRFHPHVNLAWDLVFLFFLLDFLDRLLVCPDRRFFASQARNYLEVFLLLHKLVHIVLQRTYFQHKVYFSDAESNALIIFFSFDVLRMLRVLYFVKDFDIMKVLVLSVRACLQELMLLALCMLSLSLLYGTALLLEGMLTDNLTVTNVPQGMWFAIITMTTVGYGDVVPDSGLGKVLGAVCAFSGLVTVALPVAVVASKFSKYHDNLVSRIQLRTRLAFLRKRPEVLRHQEDAETEEQEGDPRFGAETHDLNHPRGGPSEEKARPCDTDCLM